MYYYSDMHCMRSGICAGMGSCMEYSRSGIAGGEIDNPGGPASIYPRSVFLHNNNYVENINSLAECAIHRLHIGAFSPVVIASPYLSQL